MTGNFSEIPSTTPDFTTEAATKLADLFPEVVADGKINLDTLKTILDVDVEEARERFGLNWPGKTQAIRGAQTPTTATLAPDYGNSKDWSTTNNAFIEGDNLEVLKILQKHYYGQIKMIYIDPPYNTGNDFVYSDDYADSIGSYLKLSGQRDDGGKLSTNSESSGRFHSNWLNMMYPRLKLARNLLTDDGVIFISISDNEYGNLKKVLDEIFGENNFEGSIHWRRRHNQPNDKTKLIGLVAEHILVYARNSVALKVNGVGKLPLTGKFANPDGDPRGPWNSKPWKAGSGQGGSTYTIVSPTGRTFTETWMGEQQTFEKLLQDNRIIFTKGGDGLPRKKQFQSERQQEGQAATNWFTHEQFGSNQEGTAEFEKLFDGKKSIFDNPKPTKLLENLILLGNLKDGDVVLDFFAGSGSTAHAVLKKNAEDGINRRFIAVQLPEETPEGSEARKAGYNSISEICRERIRRAGARVLEGEDLKLDGRKDLDVGFRAYKLVDTNFSKWQVSSDIGQQSIQDLLARLAGSADDDARPEALLTEILLKLGFSLTEKIEVVDVNGLSVFSVAGGLVMAYLDEHALPSLEQLRALVAQEPERLVVLEDAFNGNDELKVNLVQECHIHNVDLWTA